MLKAKQLFKRSRAFSLASILFLSQLGASLSPLLISSTASAVSVGPNSGSSFAGNISAPSGDHNWTNSSNTISSNNSHATVEIDDSDNVSNYLRATGFGFSIPAGSTINGITVGIERSEANSQQASIRDNVVSLVKNNVVTGQNKATVTNWPTADAVANYGATNDLWGTTWTVTDVNNANFGVVLSIGRTSGGDETARVDHITISVDYTAPLAQPTLTLIKTVTNNNGGTATTANFQAKIDGNNVAWSTPITLSAGAHTATEVAGVAGYSAGSWGGSCAANGTVTLSLGQNATCTITNDDIAPSLTLNKIVVNDNGGSATESNWILTASGTGVSPTNLSGSGAAGSTDVVSGPTFKAGTYTLAENGGPVDYTPTSWTCTNGVVVTNSQIVLASGQTTVCSITNNDNAPSLKLVKLLGATYGSNANVSNWNLTATGALDSSTDLSGATGTVGATSGSSFKADTYTLGETGPSGFTASWSCVGGNAFNTISQAIAISLGQAVTCTVTNTGIQPKLTVIKEVTNDNGGDKVVADFPLTVEIPMSTTTNVTSGEKNGFDVGSYNVGEMYVDSQYSATFSGDCDANGQVVLDLGDDFTCTITNDDIAPVLTLTKNVTNDNSGTATAADWTLTATPSDDTKPTLSGNGENGFSDKQAYAGVTYTLSESGPTDYSAGDWVCEGGTLDGNELTLELGTDVVCVITNNDIPHPEIRVDKYGPTTAAAGTIVTYLFHVTNTGDTLLGKVQIEDDIAGVPNYISGDVGNDEILSPGEVWVYSAEYTIPAGQVADVVNTVNTCSLPVSRVILVDDSINRLTQNNIVLNPTICDTDSHTLEIPQVLGATTPGVSQQRLVNTGSGSSVLRFVLPILLIGLAGLVTRRQNQTTSK